MVRDGGDPGQLPPSLRDVLLSRVDGLSPAAQRLLRTAAVAGRGVPAALAYHWYAALDLPRALSAAVEAAARAMASYASAEALRHLERALEIWPQVADAEQRTGLDLVEVNRASGTSTYCPLLRQSDSLGQTRILNARLH
jgi:hypothetical protein